MIKAMGDLHREFLNQFFAYFTRCMQNPVYDDFLCCCFIVMCQIFSSAALF